MIPAFFNGFPLVYSDTGTYIISGMEMAIPKDRPVIYGLFIKYFSLNFSLWFVLFFQSAIASYVIWEFSKLFFKGFKFRYYILLVFLLSSFTGLSWYSSQIMPDIFTLVSIMLIVLLLFENKHSQTKNAVFYLFLLLSVSVHFSNILIAAIVLIGLFVISKSSVLSKSLNDSLRYRLPILGLIGSIVFVSLVNFSIGRTFKINQGSHVYLMGRMLDSGVLVSFLQKECNNYDYALCPYKDRIPEHSRKLLWDQDSPLYDLGGWENSRAAFNEVLFGILTNPKHLSLFVFNSFTSTIAQLFQNDIGSGIKSDWYATPSSPPYAAISKHFNKDLNQYIQSRQNTNIWGQGLDFDCLNIINHLLLIFSVLVLLAATFFESLKSKMPDLTRFLIIALVLGVLSNALVTASFANVYDRLQARISWVLIYLGIILSLYFVRVWSNGNFKFKR